MSRGPGRVQRTILELISAPEAYAQIVPGKWDGDLLGPVGVPVSALIEAIYETRRPSRAQKESVRRAISALRRQGVIGIYSRRVCSRTNTVAEFLPPDKETLRFPCCGFPHISEKAVGRPMTEEEEAEGKKQFARVMAMVRAL